MSFPELGELKRFLKGLAAGDPLEKERRQRTQRYCEQMRSADIKEVLRSMNQIAAKKSVRSQDYQRHLNHSFQWNLKLLKCSFCPIKGQPLKGGKNTCDGSATQMIPTEYNSEEKITERCASCSAFCCKYAETRHYALIDPGFKVRLCNSLAAKLYLIDLEMQAEIQSSTYHKRAKHTSSSMAGIPLADYNKKYLGWKGFHHATVDKGKAKDLSRILVKKEKKSKDGEGSSSGERIQTNDGKRLTKIHIEDPFNSPEHSKKYEKGREHACLDPPSYEISDDEDSVVTVVPKIGREHSSGKKIPEEVDTNDEEKDVEGPQIPESTERTMFKIKGRNKEKKGKNKAARNSPNIGESSATGAEGNVDQSIRQIDTSLGYQAAKLSEKRSFFRSPSAIGKSTTMSKVNEAVHPQNQESIFRRFRRSTHDKAATPLSETPNNLMYELLYYLAMHVEEDICIFMKCHGCGKTFCPDCLKRCEEPLCGKPLCPSCQRAELVEYLKENTDFTVQHLKELDLRGTWNKCNWHRSL